MICTKAYIKELPEEGSNIFKVEVPLMEDNTGTEAIFDALLCTTPGNYKGLKVGDAVFVEFEDDQYNTAIILGELFTEIPTKSTAYSVLNELRVTDAASLPPNTRFGDYTAQDIMNLYNKGGGAGTINDDDLKQYVQWINTETTTSEGDIIDVYADKIRVMSGQEYDKLIEELGSEGVAEDINFINTLHFLWSIPGTAPSSEGGGGDDPDPGPTPPEPPTPVAGISFKALANSMKSKLGTTVNYSFQRVMDYAISVISVPINSLLLNDKTGSASKYIYFPHFAWLESKTAEKWNIFYKYLPNPSLANGRGAGGWKAGDWENFSSNDTALTVGDIVTFVNASGNAVYAAVYGGDNQFYGCNNIVKETSNIRVQLSKDKIMELTSATDYKITRITQALVDRHKGSPIT